MNKAIILASSLFVANFAQAEMRDLKDTECRVILNAANINCVRSNCTLITSVLVHDSLGGAAPMILARQGSDAWSTYRSGYTPFHFGNYMVYQIDLFPGAVSSAVEFIPFVEAGDARWFDHNAYSGDTENYIVGGNHPSLPRTGTCGVY